MAVVHLSKQVDKLTRERHPDGSCILYSVSCTLQKSRCSLFCFRKVIFFKKVIIFSKLEVLRAKSRVKIRTSEVGKTTSKIVSPIFEEILTTFEVVLPFLGPKKGRNCSVSSLYYKDTTFSHEIQICFDSCLFSIYLLYCHNVLPN